MAVAALLSELGATPPPRAAIQNTAEEVLDNPDSGALLLADANGAVVGVLSVSWQIALHVPGPYGLIQDLWVERSWRKRAVGASLLRALERHALKLGVRRLEVGLPKESYAGLDATAAFYRASGFDPLGPRMRRLIRMSGLEPFRRRLDELDEQIAGLLGERFAVCREVALYKRAHDIPMMQPERVVEVRERYLARGTEVGAAA